MTYELEQRNMNYSLSIEKQIYNSWWQSRVKNACKGKKQKITGKPRLNSISKRLKTTPKQMNKWVKMNLMHSGRFSSSGWESTTQK